MCTLDLFVDLPISRQLFGEDEEDSGAELDEAEQQGENGTNTINPVFISLASTPAPLAAQEIATLRKEAQAFRAVRDTLRSTNANGSPLNANPAAKLVFQKVRHAYINWCTLVS